MRKELSTFILIVALAFLILITIDFHANIYLVTSKPKYESRGWIVSPSDYLYYEVDSNITSSKALKTIFSEYDLDSLEQCGIVKAKKIVIDSVPRAVNLQE